jgi:hypothetical protein
MATAAALGLTFVRLAGTAPASGPWRFDIAAFAAVLTDPAFVGG